MLDVSVASHDASALTVAVSGDVDMDTADHLTHVLTHVVDQMYPVIALDIAGVTFLGSAGIKVLVDLHHQAGLRGSTLVLRNVQPTTRRVLEITGLLDFFDVPVETSQAPRRRVIDVLFEDLAG
jgi:anti-sigma B factor antagonist